MNSIVREVGTGAVSKAAATMFDSSRAGGRPSRVGPRE